MIFFGIYSLSLETNQAEENFGTRGQDRRGEMKCALNWHEIEFIQNKQNWMK